MLNERTWHEQQLLDDLEPQIASGMVEIVEDAVPLYQRLVTSFPVRSERIDWTAVPGALCLEAPPERATSNFELAEPASALREFWCRIRRANAIADDLDVVVVGDGLTRFALRMSIKTLMEHLVDIFSIPQQTYVFPEDVVWCFHYTAEDDGFFGLAPRRTHRR
jgi:hypothetical protein